jgi:hypothetical protein
LAGLKKLEEVRVTKADDWEDINPLIPQIKCNPNSLRVVLLNDRRVGAVIHKE